MRRPLFSPEELAELAAFDAEVDAQPGYDAEEIRAQRRRDTEARWATLNNRERAIAEYQRAYQAANREAIAEYKRAYREKNRDAIAEYHRAYREKNRDAIAEYRRAYREANRDAIAKKQRDKYRATTSDQNAEKSPLRLWRRAHGLTQKAAALLLGVSPQQVSFYERSCTPIPERIAAVIGV